MIENIFDRAMHELENIEGIGSEEWLKGWSRLERQSRTWVLDSTSNCGLLGVSVEITDGLLADGLARIASATWQRLAQDWFSGQYQSYVIQPGFAPFVPEETEPQVYQAAFGPLPCEEIFGPFQTWAGEGEQNEH